MTPPAPLTPADRRWTVLLWILALTLPVGALVQPWLFPSRSQLPIVPRRVHQPLILVTLPGLRADRVHHLGYERPTTPNLDELAWHGISITRAYAASNDAAATAASLLTGEAPGALGMTTSGAVLAPGQLTLAERLQAVGYHCIALVADPDLAAVGLDQGFDVFETFGPDVSADTILQRGFELLESAPVPSTLLWIDLADLRPPYGGPSLDPTTFAPDMPADFGASADDSFFDPIRRGWSRQQVQWLEDRYDAALLAVDAALGRFLDELERAMRLDMLTLVVTGTRGTRLGERPGLAFAHGVDLYQGSIHVPLLLRVPAQRVRGLVLNRFAQSVDLVPTLLDMLQRQELPELCGRSLARDIRALDGTNRFAVSEGRHLDLAGTQTDRAYAAVSTVRNEPVKLIVPLDPSRRAQLFDLARDAGEITDRASEPGNTEFVSRVLAILDEWRVACGLD